MSIEKVLISTQYEENYGFHEGNFHWKPKGGHTFVINMDADILLYSDPAKVFAKMLEAHNTDLARFTYLDYEIVWQEPTVLGTQEDYISVEESIDEETNHVIAGVDFSDSINQLNNL